MKYLKNFQSQLEAIKTNQLTPFVAIIDKIPNKVMYASENTFGNEITIISNNDFILASKPVFTILIAPVFGGIQYVVSIEKGMTWEDLINSKYNKYHFFVNKNNNIQFNDKLIYDGTIELTPNDIILNKSYVLWDIKK